MTDKQLAVLVLAAGEGTRMKSAKPKVMHELAGIPLLGHALATATELGADFVVPVIRHQRDLLEAYIQRDFADAIIADQDSTPGTGRAVECGLAALPAEFSGSVVVTSGDVPLLDVETLQALVEIHTENGNAATILTAIMDDPTGYGRIVRGVEGAFERIVEHRDASDEQLDILEVNAGVYVFDGALLRDALANVGTNNSQAEKYLTDVAAGLLTSGHAVEALAVSDNWLVAGINDRVQLAEVAAELNYRLCEAWMRAGVTILDPNSTWIDLGVQLAEDVTILPGTHLRGSTRVGRGSVVGPEVVMVDTEVGELANVVKSHISGSKIGDGAIVGPFSYLRPGTDLGADGKIGTFVETKNAKIGAGSKVPHLSYVGDAHIGEHSNIGAGTIFANYDGVAKHSSTIGSHVRTGSHNVFVAPITIGDGAYTAAGTVVRRSVSPGELAMNVAPQRNLADWVIAKRPGTQAAEAAQKAKN
jgi:bifunctional UDP-N-acetylglucosamine pyrophosphorylase / glucosamine-1-phosphate N-acetyltransferase